MEKLRPGIHVINKSGLYYAVDEQNRPIRFKPWLGDSLSFLYDYIMRTSVFPRTLGADVESHHEILTRALAGIRDSRILELGTGSGSAVHFLNSDNQYTGSDISSGLLKRATKRFAGAGFREPEFYVASADDLPFANGIFDLCLCVLSLNFFGDVPTVFREIRRVLVPAGTLVCSVPVPERNALQSRISGVLYSEAELDAMCQENGLDFKPIPGQNGALLYFRAVAKA